MDIDLRYRPEFIRLYNKLESDLKEEIKEKIALFRKTDNHKLLKVHKLHGKFRGCYSFSVNYRFRIVFEYINKKIVALMTVGDHDVYK